MKAYGILALSGQSAAPTVPQNVAGTALHARRIRLTWDASTDDVAVTGYQIYRDSVPLDTTTALTYDDTTVSAEITYSYQVSAFDAAGNSSALSAAAVVTTPANSAPAWQATISESLAVGNAYSRDLNTVCSDADGDTITYAEAAVQEAPPSGYTQGLPPGVTFNTTLGRLDGTPTTAGSYAYTIDADDGVSGGVSDMDADFEERATAAGALYFCNTSSTWINRALVPARSIASTADLIAEAVDVGPNPENLARVTTRGLSGGASIEISVLDTSGGGDSGAHFAYRPNGIDDTRFTRFYATVAMYCPRDDFAYRYKMALQGGGTEFPQQLKIWNWDQSASGQIAWTARYFLGFINYFTQDGGGFNNSGGAQIPSSNPWGTGSFREWIQNGINNPGTPSTKDEFIAKYGPLPGIASDSDYTYNASNPLLYNRSHANGWPDARAAASGVAFNMDGWTVLTGFVDYNVSNPSASTFMAWASNYGDPPKLIFSQIGNCPLGTNDVYRRFELLNYDTHKAQEIGIRPTLRSYYTEWGVSTLPINHPGGFTLPGNLG